MDRILRTALGKMRPDDLQRLHVVLKLLPLPEREYREHGCFIENECDLRATVD